MFELFLNNITNLALVTHIIQGSKTREIFMKQICIIRSELTFLSLTTFPIGIYNFPLNKRNRAPERM